MAEIINSDKERLARLKKQITGIFDRDITDPVIREYIFGDYEVDEAVGKLSFYIPFINNVFTLAFYFAYDRYIRYKNYSAEPLKPGKNNARRIISSLDKTFVQHSVTNELIQFVLSDIQFELKQGTDSELYPLFGRMCSFDKADFTFSKYFKELARYRHEGAARYRKDPVERAELFKDLLSSMKFLHNYALVESDCNGYEFALKDDAEIDPDPFDEESVGPRYIFFNDPDSLTNIYSLVAIEKLNDGGRRKLNLRYSTSDNYSIVFSVYNDPSQQEGEVSNGYYFRNANAEECLNEIVVRGWDDEPEGSESGKKNELINQIHTINYKYIKNLSLAISDAISTNYGSETVLYNKYRARHADVFKMCSANAGAPFDPKDTNNDWDGIIVMLLIEESPTAILEHLISNVPQTFHNIVKNLCQRIYDPDMPIFGKTDAQLNDLVNEEISNKLIIGESGGFGKVSKRNLNSLIFARAAAMLILSSISHAQSSEKDERRIYAGNIYDNKNLLQQLKNDPSVEKRAKYVSIILGETFKHLICFYNGVIAYGKIKSEFNAESYASCLSDAQLENYKEKFHAAFLSAAREKAKELSRYSTEDPNNMLKLMDLFVKFCKGCNSVSHPEKTANLFTALGKYEILNLKDFDACVRKHLGTIAPINDSNIDNWINFSLQILEYLKTGSFGDTKINYNLLNTTYPFIATYRKCNENYDGCKTVTFKLDIDIALDGVNDYSADINVLTELPYTPREVYYCLPNVLRSNQKWWIDPILISFKDFNSIFN